MGKGDFSEVSHKNVESFIIFVSIIIEKTKSNMKKGNLALFATLTLKLRR